MHILYRPRAKTMSIYFLSRRRMVAVLWMSFSGCELKNQIAGRRMISNVLLTTGGVRKVVHYACHGNEWKIEVFLSNKEPLYLSCLWSHQIKVRLRGPSLYRSPMISSSCGLYSISLAESLPFVFYSPNYGIHFGAEPFLFHSYSFLCEQRLLRND